MTDKRITDLPEYTGDLDPNDFFEYIDVSDTTDNAAGSSRKIKSGRVGLTFKMVVPAPTGVVAPTLPGVCLTAGSATAAVTSSTSLIGLSPIVLHRRITITEAVVVLTTSSGSSVVRIGLYSATGAFVPGSLLVDWGTVSSASTGRKTLAVSTTVEPGNYLVAVAANATVQAIHQRVHALTLAGVFLRPDFTTASTMWPSTYTVTATSPANGLPSTLEAVSTTSSGSPGYLCPVFFSWTLA
jgi:hypothetical protein